MTDRFDAAIVGAGLNGLACALALAGKQALRPLHVAIVDAKPLGVSHDARASAVTASSKRMFEALGVWDAIAPHAEAMREIVVTDSADAASRPALLHFAEPGERGEPSAWMVENRHLVEAMLGAVRETPGIAVRIASVTRFAFGPGLARLDLDDGYAIKTDLIVAADGRNSPARAAAGIALDGWSYGQSAIVTTVAHEHPHGGRAEEHFRPAGPFAILPLPGNRASLVWTESESDAARIVALDDTGFLAELESRLGDRLGEVRLEGQRQSYPLSLFVARAMTAERLALVGDAAHVIHPIAGLGFNLGLRDAAALADAVADAVKLGLDPGGAATLEAYARRRRFDTAMTAAATDGLNRLFSNDLAPLRGLRAAGLRAVDAMVPLKSWFMREAAGDTGALPRLMRGDPA